MAAESQIPAGDNKANNKAIAEQFLRYLSSEGSADGAEDLIHPDYVGHVVPFPDYQGPEGCREFAARTLERYPDARYIVEDIMATDDDKVVIRGTFSGTYRARDEMDQMFDDQPITMPTITILQIAEGKVTESWASFDLVGPMQRWGVIPDFLGISKENKEIRVFVGGEELKTTEPVKVLWGDTELKWPLIPSQQKMAALLWPWRW
jgi:predicted ester cyclase